MAARDSRSRNNRSTRTTTQQRTRTVDGGTSTQTYKGIYDDVTNKFYTQDGRAFATRQGDGSFKTNGGLSASLGGSTEVNRNAYRGSEIMTAYGPRGEMRELDVTYQNPDKQVTDTVSSSRLQADDLRTKDGDGSDKAAKADRKKKGRSGLRIQMSTDDPSAGRIKQGGKKTDKKSGAQGGGKSGLNIPR